MIGIDYKMTQNGKLILHNYIKPKKQHLVSAMPASARRLMDAMQGPGAGAGHDQGQGLGPLLQVALPQMRVHLHTALQDTLLLYCVMCVLSGYLHKTHAGHVTPESAEALRGAGGTRTGRLRPSSPTDSVSYFHLKTPVAAAPSRLLRPLPLRHHLQGPGGRGDCRGTLALTS